jgi:hypothetical protein
MDLQRSAIRINQPTEREFVAGLGGLQQKAFVRAVGEIRAHGCQ